MKKLIPSLTVLLLLLIQNLNSQEISDIEVYLLTCGPGVETYSVYGHSALRIVSPRQNRDLVYNWGVFDFNTTNFGWKFAKGKLEYMLGVYPYDSFIKEYEDERRWVISQKINLDEKDKSQLFLLINENLKPENIKYRYDFFQDNCSTRIRDLLEKATGKNLIYPTDEPRNNLPTFRELSGDYQKSLPWMKFGIDLLLGSPSDKKAGFRDRMFLPLYLQEGLSTLVVRRNGKMIPLLSNPETKLSFKQPEIKENFLTSPTLVFSFALILFIILTAAFRKKKFNRILDSITYSIFSLLAILMIFLNFFSLHPQLHWNFNIMWLDPLIIVCLVCVILRKDCIAWFRFTFGLIALFLLLMALLPQHFDNAIVPLAGILLLRTSVRAGFGWNPFTLPDLT